MSPSDQRNQLLDESLSNLVNAMRDAKNRADSYLEVIINNVPHSIIWKDCNSVFLGCNQAFAESAGFNDPKDLIGKTDFDMPWHAQAHLYVIDDKEVILSGEPKLDIEEPQELPDGTVITLNTNKVPLLDDNGKIIGVLAIYTDVTRKKEAQKELLIAKEKAEIANQAKSDFIASTSHELRTPLNAIMGMTQILLKKSEDDETQQMLTTILQAGSHLLGMITDILNFSKLEAAKFALEMSTFSIKNCINFTLNNLNHLLEDRPEIKLTASFSHDLPDYISFDERCLRQLLFNLVGNAIKFTHEGQITVTAHLLNQNEDYVTLRIDVTDTGIGIPADKVESVFERFTQLDSTYDRRYGGTGLGLAICQRLVERSGGIIGVESEENKGSCFWFTVPCRVASVDEERLAKLKGENKIATEVPGSAGSFSSLPYQSVGWKNKEKPSFNQNSTQLIKPDMLLYNKVVVMIEDERMNRAVLERMILDLGTQPIIFADAYSALKYFEETDAKIDVILTDIGLPDMNGTELIRQVRKIERYQKVPVFAITGYNSRGDLAKIFSVGINEVLNKPIMLTTLEETLDRYLNGPHALTEENEELQMETNAVVNLEDKSFFDYEKTLKNYNGNMETVDMLLDMFQDELPKYRELISTALQQKDTKTLAEQAHKLKGGVSILIMPNLRESAVLVERSIKEFGFNDQVEQFAQELMEEIKHTECKLPPFIAKMHGKKDSEK